MFGCRYSTGRAEGAPALRRNPGPPPAPILTLTKEGSRARWLEREGVRFEAVGVAEFSAVVPEARVHDAAWLPHKDGDQICQFLSRATAADAFLETPELPGALERRGERLGRK